MVAKSSGAQLHPRIGPQLLLPLFLRLHRAPNCRPNRSRRSLSSAVLPLQEMSLLRRHDSSTWTISSVHHKRTILMSVHMDKANSLHSNAHIASKEQRLFDSIRRMRFCKTLFPTIVMQYKERAGGHTSMLWASFMIFTMLGLATFVAKACPMCVAHSEYSSRCRLAFNAHAAKLRLK